jgi:hypothetical protein
MTQNFDSCQAHLESGYIHDGLQNLPWEKHLSLEVLTNLIHDTCFCFALKKSIIPQTLNQQGCLAVVPPMPALPFPIHHCQQL